MKQLKREKFSSLLQSIYIIISLLIVIIFSFLITYKKASLLNLSYASLILAIIGLIVFLINKIKNFKFNRYELLIFGLIFFSIISTIFSINKESALLGTINRNEGLYAYLFYYFLALNALNVKKGIFKKIIIWEILLIGLTNINYGLLQTGKVTIPDVVVPASWHYARGLNGNSMYYASLLSLCYPIVVGIFIKENNYKKAIALFLLTWLFTLGILMSGAMAIIVASICMFIFMIIKQLVTIYHNSDKVELTRLGKIFIVIVLFILTNIQLRNSNDIYKKDLNQLASETSSVTSGKVDDSFGSRRIFVWKESLKKAKEYPITGIGIDNYLYGFNPVLRDPKTGEYFTKAHNDYIQKTVCEGFISGIYYIFVIAYIFFSKIKKNDKIFYPLLLAFICYSIQIFFSISVTRVTPYYFVIIGLLLSGEEIVENINKKKKSKKH